MRKLWLLHIFIAFGCNRLGFVGASDEHQIQNQKQNLVSAGDFEVSNSDQDSPKRPTDEAEGVDGYLTDPDLVAANPIAVDQVVLTGKQGAVAVHGKGLVSDVVIGVWETKQTDESYLDGPSVAVKNLACGQANRDGSFRLVAAAPMGRLVVSSGFACNLNGLTPQFHEGGATAFWEDSERRGAFERIRREATSEPIDGGDPVVKDVSGPRVGGFNPDSVNNAEMACWCPPGEYFDDARGTCSAMAPLCDPYLFEDVPVCGCDHRDYFHACDARDAGIISFKKGYCI